MTDAIIAGLVAVAAIAGASFVGGWHMGSSGPTKRLAGLEAVVADQALRAQGARDDAQRAIDQLTARALEAETRAPSVEYRDVIKYRPARPLPANACADAQFARLLDAVSAERERGAEGRVIPAPARAAPAATGAAGGFVSAAGFRDWAAWAAEQHRREAGPANALKRAVPALPCVKLVD